METLIERLRARAEWWRDDPMGKLLTEAADRLSELEGQRAAAPGDDPALCPAGHFTQCCRDHAACRRTLAAGPPS
jgi:hypothetical protein